MKHAIAILVASFLVAGCQSPGGGSGGGLGGGISGVEVPTQAVPVYSTDPVFVSYVERFQSMARYYGRTDDVSRLAVIFNDSNLDRPSTIASCMISTGPQNVVSVRRSYWDAATELVKQALIFHELGHCMLLRPHRGDVRVSDMTPISLMYPYIISNNLYNNYYNVYNDELFQYMNYTALSPYSGAGAETIERYSTSEEGCEHDI